MPTKTMFGKPKHKYLSDIISIKNPTAARRSVKELMREFKTASTQVKRLRIARATQLASNRANVSSFRLGVLPREVEELKQVSKIYDVAAKRMFKLYKGIK